MSPKVPRLRWDDPFRALEMLCLVVVVDRVAVRQRGSRPGGRDAVPDAVRDAAATARRQGSHGACGDHDVMLTVTEFDSELEPRELAVGQLGEVRVGARDISWDENHLQSAVAVLHNVHIPSRRAPAGGGGSGGVDRDPAGKGFRRCAASGGARNFAVSWARRHSAAALGRRPGLGGLEVDVDVMGTTLWLRPSALVTGQRRWKLPARIPAYPVPLPELPHGLLVTGVELASDTLRISGLLPQWRMELPMRALEDLITQLSRGVFSLVLP